MSHLSFKRNAILPVGIAFIMFILFSSCEKEVKINLKEGATQVVVDGAIENDVPPYVVLTKSIGFFSSIDLNTLENSFLHDATITVSDGTNTVTLKEYAVDTGTANKFYFYSIDTAFAAVKMKGEIGKTYSLKIVYEGKTYEASSKLPNPKAMDTIWAGDPFAFGQNVADGAKTIYVNYADPDTLGNYGLYYTKTNDQPYYMSQDLYTDEFTNGSLQTSYPLTLGLAPGQDRQEANDSLGYVFKGDTVTLKWCAIDKKVYDFWKSYVYASNVSGNPFSTPINLKTNISNGALGIWAAYGAVYNTIVVQ